MADHAYVGRGASGLKGLTQLPEDIQKLSDAAKAKRKKALENKVRAKQKAIKARKPVSARKTERIMKAQRTPLRVLEESVVTLRAKATAVDRSGTGNIKAAATYRRAAKIRLRQIARLKSRGK